MWSPGLITELPQFAMVWTSHNLKSFSKFWLCCNFAIRIRIFSSNLGAFYCVIKVLCINYAAIFGVQWFLVFMIVIVRGKFTFP